MPRNSESAPGVNSLPRVDDVVPAAALPLGEVELTGVFLGPHSSGLPTVFVDGEAAHTADEPAHAAGFPRARGGRRRPG